MSALNIKSGRQNLIYAYLDFTFDQLVTGTDQNAIQLPPGAVVAEGEIIVDTVWNSATSDVISVGDSGSFNRYKSALTIQAAARTVIVPTGYIYVAPTYVTIRWVGVSTAPTTGAGRLVLGYYVRGRSQFNQGPDQGARLV